jgi:RNA polymerase sigma-70 factor (ECF subfamily)
MQMNDEARILREAMAHLPEHQRAVIALYYFEEMTAAQVAAVLDRSLGSTEVLLTRARHALHSLLTNKGVIGKERKSQ